MRYFYIDTENVNGDVWAPYLANLLKTDVVYIIQSVHSKYVHPRFIESMVNTKATIKCVSVQNGTPNAMDFILVNTLAVQACKSKKSMHFIISKDTGYTPVVKYWRAEGIWVERSADMGAVRKSIPKIGTVVSDGNVCVTDIETSVFGEMEVVQ